MDTSGTAPSPRPVPRRLRRLAALVAVLGASAACGAGPHQVPRAKGAAAQPAAEPPPNVLIVVLDTLRYDSTGLAGKAGETPFLESLARKGIEFSRAYSTHDSTPPSHFSLLTGFVNGQYTAIDKTEYALPFQLERLQYLTFGVAANGNLVPTSMPVLRGFRDYVNLYEDWRRMPEAGKARFLGTIDERIGLYGGRRNDYNHAVLYCSWERVLPSLERLLVRLAAGRRPFFAFVNMIEPHDPYFPDPALVRQDRCGRDLPEGFDADIRYRTLPNYLSHPKQITDRKLWARLRKALKAAGGPPWMLSEGLTPQQLALYRCRYDAEVREADRDLAQLFGILEREKLLDSTIVLVTSDHGESFGEAGYVTHSFRGAGDLEATQRIPLLLLLPSRFGARSARVDEPVTLADVAPTLYDLIGVDWHPLVALSPIGNFGRSLAAQLGVERRSRPGGPRVWLPSAERETAPSEGKPSDEAVERLRALGYVE